MKARTDWVMVGVWMIAAILVFGFTGFINGYSYGFTYGVKEGVKIAFESNRPLKARLKK